MRTAQPVGLSQDGKSLIVKTGDGEQIAVLADSGLRDLLRNRPRPQLEIEMETALTPREIQMKIRAGASVDELAQASGMPTSRVEAFAAPVIAERAHIAGLAQSGSVRQAGESTGHRTLRAALTARLRELKIDPETVTWDSFKMDDGRWSVSADYRVENADRSAVFYFDQRGRFSVAGNDEARWAIGEALAVDDDASADDNDTEPTLKLASSEDELALLRSVETEQFTESGDPAGTGDGAPDGPDEAAADDADQAAVDDPTPEAPAETAELGAEQADEIEPAVADDATALEASATSAPEVTEEVSQLDLLYDLLGADGYAEDSVRVFDGLSDAAAVPEVPDAGWTPPASEEPSAQEPTVDEDTAVDEAPDDTSADEPAVDESDAEPAALDDTEPDAEATSSRPAEQAPTQLADGATQDILPVDSFEEPAVEDLITASSPVSPPAVSDQPSPTPEPVPENTEPGSGEPEAAEPEAAEPEAAEPEATEPEATEPAAKPKPKPKKRKRAAVPSWDEIMFGSPKSK